MTKWRGRERLERIVENADWAESTCPSDETLTNDDRRLILIADRALRQLCGRWEAQGWDRVR